MKVVVVTDEIAKQEMVLKPVAADVEFIWVDNIEEIEKYYSADAFIDLKFDTRSSRINILKKFLPKPVLINSVAHTLVETNPNFIRINAWPTFLKRNICETAVINDNAKTSAVSFFDALSWAYQFVPDIKGMVSARIVAAIINEAYFTLQAAVSTKEEIDIAMKLGTNYPYGPFEWSEKIGLKNIYELLFELSKTDNCYQVSKALQEEVWDNK